MKSERLTCVCFKAVGVGAQERSNGEDVCVAAGVKAARVLLHPFIPSPFFNPSTFFNHWLSVFILLPSTPSPGFIGQSGVRQEVCDCDSDSERAGARVRSKSKEQRSSERCWRVFLMELEQIQR